MHMQVVRDQRDTDTKISKGLIKRTAASFKPYWMQGIVIVLLILVTGGLGAVNPVLIRVVFDSALFPESGSPDLNLLWIIGGVMTAIIIVTGGLGILQTYLTNLVGQKVMRDLRDRLYSHLQKLSIGFFTGTRTGEIQSRISNDVGGIQNVVTNTVTNVLSNTVIFISTLIAMLVLSWQLTLVAVGMAPVFFFLSKYVGERRSVVMAESQKAAAEVLRDGP